MPRRPQASSPRLTRLGGETGQREFQTERVPKLPRHFGAGLATAREVCDGWSDPEEATGPIRVGRINIRPKRLPPLIHGVQHG
jgi:hypothetical protein